MGRISPHAQISSSSRRRLARWLVGSPLSVVERDLILETLAHTHGNRTVSARLLGVSVRTLRNKINEYSAEGLDIPHHESRDKISRAETIVPTNPGETPTNQPAAAPPSTVGTVPQAGMDAGTHLTQHDARKIRQRPCLLPSPACAGSRRRIAARSRTLPVTSVVMWS